MSKENAAAVTMDAADLGKPDLFETVSLQTPIPRKGGAITELTLRKPAAGELRGLSLVDLMKMDVNELTILLPRISQPTITADDVRKLDPADLVELGGAVVGFLLKKEHTA